MAKRGKISNPKPPPPGENKVQEYREKKLDLSVTEFARKAKLSERTIRELEKPASIERGFRQVTYQRVLNTINAALKRKGEKPIELEALFPNLPKS